MKRIISYNKFNEDAMAGGDGGGMGAISNAGVSSIPGDVSGSTPGSGDVSFPLNNSDGNPIVYTKQQIPSFGFKAKKKDQVKPKKKKEKKETKDILDLNINSDITTRITKVDE